MPNFLNAQIDIKSYKKKNNQNYNNRELANY